MPKLLKDKNMAIIKFILPSALGLFLFLTPLSYKGKVTLSISVISQALQSLLGNHTGFLLLLLTTGSALISAYYKTRGKPLEDTFWTRLWNVSPVWFFIRLLAWLLTLATFFHWGPHSLWSDKTGGMIFHELLPILFCVFFVAGFSLPLLLSFGLLEFCGVIFSGIMKPLFTLPGRSSIDCLASWLGDGTVGIMLTSKQYGEGHYTAREAAVIGSTFSVVSLTFTVVILSMVNLNAYIFPYYLTVILVGVILAMLMPRIPPLSLKKDTYLVESPSNKRDDSRAIKPGKWAEAFEKALQASRRAPSFTAFIKDGAHNVFEMWFSVLPIVMSLGTLALIIAEYTPLFEYLAAPLIPVLQVLQIPEAKEASQCLIIGFADMFLPVVLAGDIQSEMTRFVIATLSVTQLIFMSETGSLLLGSKIPLNFFEILTIFVLRTFISLPIIALVAHFIFS